MNEINGLQDRPNVVGAQYAPGGSGGLKQAVPNGRDRGAIMVEIEHAMMAVEILEKNLANHFTKIAPIMNQEPHPSDAEKKDVEASSAPLAGIIRSFRKRVENLSSQVFAMTDHIEL